MTITAGSLPPVTGITSRGEDALREAARKLESTFLEEMLSAAGAGRPREGFGGGAGEEQFSEFLLQAQADDLARSGGLGLAESIFEALKDRSNDIE